jgi:hypothetical protein
VDGRASRTIVSSGILAGHAAGMTASGAEAAQARFEDFSVAPAKGQAGDEGGGNR